MILRSEGNQLFFDNEEIREWACGRSDGPAHFQRIVCVGSSLKGTRIISADVSAQLKIWDLSRPWLERSVFVASGYSEATAAGVTDDGKRMAVATGLVVTVYDIKNNREAQKLESATPPLRGKITFLQFTDDDHITCGDNEGNKVVLERDPAWKVKVVG